MSKELNKTNAEIAAKAYEVIGVDKDTGNAHRPDNLAESLLPTDLTMDLVKKVDNWKTSVGVGVADAFSRRSLEAVTASQAAGGTLNVATLDMDIGHKENLHMQYTGRLELPGDKVEYGHLSIVHTTQAGQAGTQMRTAMKMAQEAANRALNPEFSETPAAAD